MPIHGVVTPVLTSLAIALAGVFPTAFDPASAFVGGAPGWIYDDSNQSTLFQDSAGTTPVTALEQPVGLQLDLSQGLVLGAELITPAANRDFSSDTGYWTKATGVTIGSGVCAFSGVANRSGVVKTLFLTIGAYYEITFTVVSCSGGGFSAYAGGTDGNLVSAPGTYTQRLAAAGTTFAISARGVTTGSIDDVSIKLVLGNHRYQPTSANRPTWSARYNEMVKTESVSASPWGATNATGSVAAISLPPNISAAGMVTASAGAGYHYVAQTSNSSSAAGASVTQLYWLRKGTTRWGWIGDSGDAVWHGASIDFDGAAITEQTNATATIVASSGSWFLIRLVYTRTSAGANRIVVGASPTSTTGGTAPNYTAAGTETVYATGFDCRPSDQATGLIPTYQRVDTATSYDSVGFPAGLRWNGSNSWMQNASVDFSGTNKVSLVVGVRKQADSAFQMITELSSSAGANNGSFSLFGSGGGTQYAGAIKGAGSQTSAGTATNFAAPRTNTLVFAQNLPGATLDLGMQINVNGTAQTLSAIANNQPQAGNYGNYPAYFGARAGSSLFFNGLTFSNIAIGIALSASQIAAFEAWTNSRTKAYA